MKSFKLVALVASFLLSVNVFCQSKTFDNVIDVEVRSTVEIVNNKQIVGYAIFYKVDKMKKSALFRLSILDENLKEIGNNEFEGPKDLILKKAVYESERILLSFYDEDKKDGYNYFVKVFDLKGKEKGLIAYEPEKAKKGMFGAAIAASLENIYEGTDNVEGKGFVSIHQSKAKTGGIDIQMISLDGKLKWEQTITADKRDRSDLYLLGSTTNTILLFQMDRGGMMDRDADIFLVGLNTDNGKERFKKPLDINDFSYEPMLIKKTNDGKVKLVSTMADVSDKFATAKPKGISISDLNDITGELKTVKDFGYLKDLGNVLEMKSESKSEDGYIKATSGTYQLFDELATDAHRKKIGTLLETPNFYHYLSAVQNLKITAAIKGVSEDGIEAVLQTVDLLHRKNSPFSTYSLGMKQRLAIGAALLGNPDVLVFDEPTNGLDPVGIAEIRSLIKTLSAKGKTIIMASHLLDEVEKVCTHVAILKKGTLLASGSVKDIFNEQDIVQVEAVDKQKLKTVLAQLNNYNSLTEVGGIVELTYHAGQANLTHINQFCFDNGVVLSHLQLKKSNFESKFLELTN